MLSSPVLDLVILLSFTYFISSLMLAAINESIATLLKTRAKDLEKTIENLLFNDEWTKFARDKIFNSPHIQSLMLNKGKFPSYIPAQNFILSLIEQIKAGDYNKENIVKGIEESLLPESMKKVLFDLWTRAQANISATQGEMISFEKGIENFYSNVMDRATGWYKRKTRRIILVIGFILAAFLNIDTIKITNDALSDRNKMSNTVDKIVESMAVLNDSDSINIKTSNDSDLSVSIDSLIRIASGKIRDLNIKYNNTQGYQLGYGEGQLFYDWGFGGKYNWNKSKGALNALGIFLLKILGLILTAFAIQLGSNYWFDLLNKAINLRATGKKPNGKN